MPTLSFFYKIISLNKDKYLLYRCILCLALSIFYIRLLEFSFFYESLGPKLIMIEKMIQDLMYFSIFIVIVMLAYGISLHGL